MMKNDRNWTTQMDAARKGIITGQMLTVAAAENKPAEEIRRLLAAGQIGKSTVIRTIY